MLPAAAIADSQSGCASPPCAPAPSATDSTGFEPPDEHPAAYTLTTYPGAQLAELTEKRVGPPRPRRGGGQRGKASAVFTKRQRSSLEKNLGKLHLEAPFHAVTLTYAPDDKRYPECGFPTDPATYRNHLDRFSDRLQYRFEVGIVWRLEFQVQRGAPHYHLVIYGLNGDSAGCIKSLLTELWADITEVSETNHASVDVSCPSTISQRKAALGYLAKRDLRQLTSPHVEHKGRFWGKKGSKHLPTVAPVTTDLGAREGIAVRRLMRRYRDKTSTFAMGAHPHNPTIRLRRGSSAAVLRYARWVKGDREYLDKQTGEITTRRELQDQRAMADIPSFDGRRGGDRSVRRTKLSLPGRAASRPESQQHAPHRTSHALFPKARLKRAAHDLVGRDPAGTHDVANSLLAKLALGCKGLSVVREAKEKLRTAFGTTLSPGRNVARLEHADLAGLEAAFIAECSDRRIARPVQVMPMYPLIPP